MVQSIIDLDYEKDRILNIVKAQRGFKNKSQAVEFIVNVYAETIMEPELKPEFVDKMLKRKTEKTVKISDFKKHFGLK